jgi:DNA-binding GntR family transcriptional regulator
MANEDGALAIEQEPDDLEALPSIAAPRKLAEDVADVLREQILSANVRRGTHLVEAKLAARLNVSRGSVREALKILIAGGLVREESRRGAFVVSLERSDVLEIYDVRAAIEGRAALILAERRDPGLLAPLARKIDGIAAAAAVGDRRALRREDLAFHSTLCELSGNGRLLEIFNRYVPLVQTLLAYDELAYPSPEVLSHEHQVILDAIRTGNGTAAAREVAAHCEQARDKVIVYFEDGSPD